MMHFIDTCSWLRRLTRRKVPSTIPPLSEQHRMQREAAARRKQRERLRYAFDDFNKAAQHVKRERRTHD